MALAVPALVNLVPHDFPLSLATRVLRAMRSDFEMAVPRKNENLSRRISLEILRFAKHHLLSDVLEFHFLSFFIDNLVLITDWLSVNLEDLDRLGVR